MKKRKTIIAAVVLLLVFVVGGAIAYFTDTDSATNTFTIGNVDISIDEVWTATDGQNIMPGDEITKEPKIKNDSTTNPAYVFMKLEVPCTSETTPGEFFDYTVDTTKWTELTNRAVACTAGGNATHVYYYGAGSLQELAASATTEPLFTNVSLITTLTGNETYLSGNKNVVVTGYGIQTKGLPTPVTPDGVWANFA